MTRILKTGLIAITIFTAACSLQEQPSQTAEAPESQADQHQENEFAASHKKPRRIADGTNSGTNQMIGTTSEQLSAASPAVEFRRQKAEPQQTASLRPADRPVDRENYLAINDNGIHLAAERPVSTFSIDVDTAAYSNIRRMLLREGRLPPSDAVRLEEMINYFRYDYPSADDLDLPFNIATEIAASPWNPDRHLLQIGIQGYQPEPEQRPAANLVFLVDISGSMQSPDKLGLVKRSLNLLVNEMRPDDRIALVVYAGAAGVVLDSTPARHRGRIHAAIASLQAGGSTNGSAGIELAYRIAGDHLIPGGINRVIIASDGDMNVGTVNLEALKDIVALNRESGVALTTLGFGTGNYNYSLMEQLADVGNGNAAYIDSLMEARKVLVNEMQSTLLTIAKDVKIQVEFNPAHVREYRLLGYENRLLKREDFRNDRVDAGEIGAGHTVTALYEFLPTDAPGGMIPDLRYGDSTRLRTENDRDNELAYVRIRYKQPDGHVSRESSLPIAAQSPDNDFSSASDNLRFAAAVAGFGQLLSGGRFTAHWGYREARELARSARGDDRHGYRGEFIRLVDMAESLAPQNQGYVNR